MISTIVALLWAIKVFSHRARCFYVIVATLRTVINIHMRPTFWKFMAHLNTGLRSHLFILSLIIDLGTICILFWALSSIVVEVFDSHLLELLGVQFLKTVLLLDVFWN